MHKLQHSSYGGRTIGAEYLLEVVGHVVRCHASVTENEAVRMLLRYFSYNHILVEAGYEVEIGDPDDAEHEYHKHDYVDEQMAEAVVLEA